jgi:hypothetical protein
MQKGNEMICDKCGKENNDMSSINLGLAGSAISKAIGKIDKGPIEAMAAGYIDEMLCSNNFELKARICQRCVSLMFRGLHKDV